MFHTTSDYAINKKDTEAIVYCDALGKITRLTRENFESEEDFALWKSLSDEDYHEIEKEEHLFRDYTLSLEGLSEGVATVDHAEVQLITEMEEAAREYLRRLLVQGMDELLTATQWERVYLHYIDEMSSRAIAEQQGVDHKAVLKSINSAKKILLKFLGNGVPKT